MSALRTTALAALALVVHGCTQCPEFADPVEAGRVTLADLTEASGLAASRANAGALWVHNDSGDGPHLYALGGDAAWLGTYTLDGASAVDWEDVAVGPGPDPTKSYVYAGDIGDNAASRGSVFVHRVAEPVIAGPPAVHVVGGVETLELTYADGPHDAEALFVDPANGDLYIITKPPGLGGGISQVFHAPAPLASGAPIVMQEVATLEFGMSPLPGSAKVTAGDIDVAREKVLVRTYTNVFVWCWEEGMDDLADVFAGEPCQVPSAFEPQGESAGFAADGQAYFTVSEFAEPPLYRYDRID